MRVFAPVIVRGEEDKGVRMWEFGKEIYMQLLGIADDEDYGDPTGLRQPGHIRQRNIARRSHLDDRTQIIRGKICVPSDLPVLRVEACAVYGVRPNGNSGQAGGKVAAIQTHRHRGQGCKNRIRDHAIQGGAIRKLHPAPDLINGGLIRWHGKGGIARAGWRVVLLFPLPILISFADGSLVFTL